MHPAANLPHVLPERALANSIFPLEHLLCPNSKSAVEDKVSSLCCCSEPLLLSEEVVFLFSPRLQVILLNRRQLSTHILQSHRVTSLHQSRMAISNFVFCFYFLLTVTFPHYNSNRTALAALPGPPKDMSAGNTSVGMVQEGPACSSPPGHCCNWELMLQGKEGIWSFLKYWHLSQETQQQHTDFAQYSTVLYYTNRLHWPYWVYMATQTTPVYQ